MKSLPTKTTKRIKKLRSNGLSFDKIAKLLNIDRETATKYSKDVRLSDEQKYRMRSNSLQKYEYTASALTNEDAISYYLLGAYMTDGHITKTKGARHTVITSKDKEWLQNIGKLLCPEKPVYKCPNSKAFSLVMNARDIYDWFNNHGCHEKKSLNIRFPKVPKQYLGDFIRGCWDGDGCLCIYTAKDKKSPQVYSFIASASKSFIVDFGATLKTLGISTTINKVKLCNSVIDGRKIIAKHNLYRLHLSKANTYKLCKLMYKHNCLCLERKHDIAKRIVAMCEDNPHPSFVKALAA